MGSAQGEKNGALNGALPAAILVSFVYLKAFQTKRRRYTFRDWTMDSGAFSAWNAGKVIDLAEYILTCKTLLAADPYLTEVIALDVIGDAKGSLANSLAMKAAGLDVMPVFHVGDDWGILAEYQRQFSKIGLSCRFGEPVKESLRFYDQCFARVWPRKLHSFGWVEEQMLRRFPFHSSDSSTWEMGPCGFGTWRTFGKMSVRGSHQNIRVEVEHYLEVERMLRSQWRAEMAELETKFPSTRVPPAAAHRATEGPNLWP